MRSIQWVWDKAPEAGEFSRIFVLKVTVHSELLKTVSYRKKLGEQDVLVAPPIILLGEQLLPLLPRYPRL